MYVRVVHSIHEKRIMNIHSYFSHAGADYSMLPPLTSHDNNFAQDLDEYTYDNANQDEVNY